MTTGMSDAYTSAVSRSRKMTSPRSAVKKGVVAPIACQTAPQVSQLPWPPVDRMGRSGQRGVLPLPQVVDVGWSWQGGVPGS